MWAKLQDERDIVAALHKWNLLVKSYTSRSMSDSKDRLPAISGIAKKYVKLLQSCLQARYFSVEKQQDPSEGPQRSSQAESKMNEMELLESSSASDLTFENLYYCAGLWYCKNHPEAEPIMFPEQLLWSTTYYEARRMDSQSTGRESGNDGPRSARINLRS